MTEARVVEDATPLLAAILKLKDASFLFVNMLGRVGGIVTHADLQKPPVRMWLFGLVTLVEMRFAELIERHCPEKLEAVPFGRPAAEDSGPAR